MACYVISFHVHDDEGRGERQESIRREIARYPRRWSDGAVALVETDQDAVELERQLYYGSELESRKDRLLVIAVADGAAVRGALTERDRLRAMLPGVTVS